jgi:hypothetical protein
MLNLDGIVAAILKMATGFSKWPPQYRKKSTLYDIITI